MIRQLYHDAELFFMIYLLKYFLQINFFEDHTKIILCPLMGAVTYIDDKRNFKTYRLASLEKVSCIICCLFLFYSIQIRWIILAYCVFVNTYLIQQILNEQPDSYS